MRDVRTRIERSRGRMLSGPAAKPDLMVPPGKAEPAKWVNGPLFLLVRCQWFVVGGNGRQTSDNGQRTRK